MTTLMDASESSKQIAAVTIPMRRQKVSEEKLRLFVHTLRTLRKFCPRQSPAAPRSARVDATEPNIDFIPTHQVACSAATEPRSLLHHGKMQSQTFEAERNINIRRRRSAKTIRRRDSAPPPLLTHWPTQNDWFDPYLCMNTPPGLALPHWCNYSSELSDPANFV